MKYFFTVTDTFGGQPNFSWVRLYKVNAISMLAAIRKVNHEEGYFRVVKTGDDSWRVPGACICIFGQEYAEEDEHWNYKELK